MSNLANLWVQNGEELSKKEAYLYQTSPATNLRKYLERKFAKFQDQGFLCSKVKRKRKLQKRMPRKSI